MHGLDLRIRTPLSKKQNKISYTWKLMVIRQNCPSHKSGSEISFREPSLVNLTQLMTPKFYIHTGLAHASPSNLFHILRTYTRGLEPTGLITVWMTVLMAEVTE